MMDTSNPYASPATNEFSRAINQRDRPWLVRLARLSWQLPVGGTGLTILISFVNDYLIGVWIFGVALLLLSAAVGFVLAVICLCLSARHRRLFGHALAGLLSSALCTCLMVTLLVGWRLAYEQRDAARRAAVQKNLDDLKSALERYESEHPEP